MAEVPVDAIRRVVDARMRESANSAKKPCDSAAVLGIIEAIKAAYHLDWEKQKLEFAREFLSRTWAGIPVPALSVCGHGTQEIRYSTYLAYFLDGSRCHGVGARYLDGVLACLGHESVDTYSSLVETRRSIQHQGAFLVSALRRRMGTWHYDCEVSCDDHR